MISAHEREPEVASQRADFYGRLRPLGLAPLWEVLSTLVTPTPVSQALPASWRFSDALPFLEEAGALISAEEAERRVLILENPGLPGQSSTTSTLYAGLQIILPGEVAPAHRHSQCALRFILQGSGAFTALNGKRVVMHPYDLVLTPGWVWHDHGNETDVPMIWLDGLDIPLIGALDASFAERWPGDGACPRIDLDGPEQIIWSSALRAGRAAAGEMDSAIFRFPFDLWRGALEAQRDAAPPHAHDGYRIEFVDPATGGSILNTMSAFAHMIPAGFETRPVRSSDSSVHVVTEGRGSFDVGDKTFQVSQGDIVAVPAWAERKMRADEDLVLFSYSDKATHEKLGLWREALL